MILFIILGSLALLVNMWFYFKEVELIATSIGNLFAKKGSIKEVKESIWLFVKDASVTAIVALVAGAGLYAFMISCIGGAMISIVLCWKRLGNWISNAIGFDAYNIQPVAAQ